MVDGEFSHDKVTRFLRQGDFDSKMLWKYVKSAVREHENQNGVLILDDSIEDSKRLINPILFSHNDRGYAPHII